MAQLGDGPQSTPPADRDRCGDRRTPIRLGQLMKLAGLVDSGGDVRPILGAGQVAVNGTREDRRGRQLRHGDVVDVAGTKIRVSAPSA